MKFSARGATLLRNHARQLGSQAFVLLEEDVLTNRFTAKRHRVVVLQNITRCEGFKESTGKCRSSDLVVPSSGRFVSNLPTKVKPFRLSFWHSLSLTLAFGFDLPSCLCDLLVSKDQERLQQSQA